MKETVDKECQERIQWILEQKAPSELVEKKNTGKKKKRSKPQNEKKPVVQEKKIEEKVEKQEKSEKMDDGFTVVTKGPMIHDVITIEKITSPSIFEESEEEGTNDEIISAAAFVEEEDAFEWNGYFIASLMTNRLSQEEIRNQKILLEYYKQQQQKKEKKKLEKQRSNKKKKGKKWIVCLTNVSIAVKNYSESDFCTERVLCSFST